VRTSRALGWTAAGLVVLLVGATAVLLLAPLPPASPGPEPGRALYQAHCASCHGSDGRGQSWRARVLLLHPGDLAGPEAAAWPERYLAEMVRHGGSSLGKPGMPAFGFVLTDTQIAEVVRYVRSLPGR
jgi:mono/diheme cytochrome c family protein